MVVRATVETRPLVVDAGDSEFTRKLDLGYIPNGGVEVLRETININVGEEVRWLDGVVSNARSGEVIRGRD